jgi:hypothetical protein
LVAAKARLLFCDHEPTTLAHGADLDPKAVS